MTLPEWMRMPSVTMELATVLQLSSSMYVYTFYVALQNCVFKVIMCTIWMQTELRNVSL